MPDLADIKGLPLILGGNIRAISKLVGHPESAVILIRGPAGSGKTILATQLAAHEALVRDSDILYCCIELLPSELDAQISGLRFGAEGRELRVGNLPGSECSAIKPRIFASIIEAPENSPPDIGIELHRALTEAKEASVVPKVVVIDSLAEGYRFGASVPRYLADALAKFAAEEGIILVLLEEVADHHESTWTFVADLVFELAHHGEAGTSAAEQRSITVRKNRFGPAQVGPHSFAIHRDRGIEIYPRLSVYLTEAAREFLPQGTLPDKHRWKITKSHPDLKIPHDNEVVLVTGDDAQRVFVTVERIISDSPYLRIDMARTIPSVQNILRCGDPFLSPEKLLSDVCVKLGELSGRVSVLVIGDLEAINGNVDPDALRRTLPILIMIGRSAGLPIVLFETASLHGALSSHFADTVIYSERLQNHTILAKVSSASRSLINATFELLH